MNFEHVAQAPKALFQLGTGRSLKGVLALAVLSTLMFVSLVPVHTFASQTSSQSPFAPNVTSLATTTATVNNGEAFIDNHGSTGVFLVVTRLSGINSISAATMVLSSPSPGVTAATGSSVFYFGFNIAVNSGNPVPAGATTEVIITSSAIKSGYTMEFWNGNAWVAASHGFYNGAAYGGIVPFSMWVPGTDLALVKA